jgi:hypothetical protein
MKRLKCVFGDFQATCTYDENDLMNMLLCSEVNLKVKMSQYEIK